MQPALADSVPFVAGEAEAKRRLSAFVAGANASVFYYAKLRDQPGANATSQLSPYLRWGMLSPRLAALAAYEASERASAMKVAPMPRTPAKAPIPGSPS